MGSVTTLVSRMIYWCTQANLGYSQSDRWNIRVGGNCDCSSLVIHCLQEAGFQTGTASYTGNLSSNLTSRGWVRVPNNGRPQYGDILLNDVHHVAVYIGGGKLAQASISENGTAYGRPGDQTDRETNVRNYYNYPWNCYLRATDSTNQGVSMVSANEIAGAVGSYRYAGNDTIYNYVHYASDNSGKVRQLLEPRFIGAKDTSERHLWVPGFGVIPLYEPKEMSEIAGDYKNITGHVIGTVLFNTAKQMHYFIAIISNQSHDERAKYRG